MAVDNKNWQKLNKAHKEFIKLSTKDIAESLAETGFKFFQQLQIHTAKDTGRAINGWLPIIDGPAIDWKPKTNLGYYSQFNFNKSKVKFNSLIWLVNSVEYIKYLDEGHSQQFPNGFTEPAVRRTTLFIQKEIKKLNRKIYNV